LREIDHCLVDHRLTKQRSDPPGQVAEPGDQGSSSLIRFFDPLADLIPDGPDLVEVFACRVVEDPIGILTREQRGRSAYYRLVPRALDALAAPITSPAV
jgi:hypothetical protein